MAPDDLDAWLDDPQRRPIIVGILNATPDSFSDGGLYLSPDAARDRVRQMIDDGADWIDVGGESTRPGSESVDADEQIRRVMPAVEAGVTAGVVVSIDTTSAAVARPAMSAGASVVNDVAAGRDDPDMPAAMAEAKAVVLMHRLGDSKTMQDDPRYDDVVAEVEAFLLERAVAIGVEPRRVLLDPGIGFGKTVRHNLQLLAATRRLADLGHPLLVGASRKRFLGTITNQPDADKRQFSTAATVAWSVANGASAIRVHDVREMREVRDVVDAIQRPAAFG